jgi:hypothetical protein
VVPSTILNSRVFLFILQLVHLQKWHVELVDHGLRDDFSVGQFLLSIQLLLEHFI